MASSLEDYLVRHPEMAGKLGKRGKRSFYTSGDLKNFDKHASVFMSSTVSAQRMR
ncbi:hypothetical protein D9M68_540920 [compost metagenome]